MDKINKFSEKYRNYIFWFFLIAVFLILDYQTILFLRPQGIHFIRQTDCLSIVANYFNNDLSFFQPQVFNLQSTDGKAASEFPILYYLTAILYYLFNEHEFILRLITIIIVSTGFFYLFKLIYILLQDFLYALGFSFLFISSTVLLYYTNNFLPDASALGLTLIGWYFFFYFIKNKVRKTSLLLSFVFFTLASLIKITFFINPITAVFSLIIFEISNKVSLKSLFKKNFILFVVFTSSIIIVLSWNLYVNYYNKINHNNCFLAHSIPIWGISKTQIIEVWGYIADYWYSKYYYQTTFHVFLLIIVVGSIFFKKASKIILIQSLLLTIGTVCYFLLFYPQFKDHDYYFITLIPAIIFLVINSFITLKNKFPKLISNILTKLLLITICILSLNYAREKLVQRYKNTDDKFAIIGCKLSHTKHYLDSLGISKNAKFIIISDLSVNGGLYFINRQGWSVKDTSKQSIATIKNYIEKGVDYVLFTEQKYVFSNFNGLKIGEENGNLIYKIK